MFTKWEEVYNENVTLMTQVSNLLDDKAKLESEVIHYKSLLIDKDNQLLAVMTELENTKKSLKDDKFWNSEVRPYLVTWQI